MRTEGGTERHTDIEKLIDAFRNFANAPNEAVLSFVVQVHREFWLTPCTLHSNAPQYRR